MGAVNVRVRGAALVQPAFVSSSFADDTTRRVTVLHGLTGRASRFVLEWATDYAAEFRA